MTGMRLADLREKYMRAGLAEAQAHADPLVQFERWFRDAEAAGVPLANAMTLATVSPAGAPSARVVLLKDLEQGGFVFYSNYLSRKGRELEAQPLACLVFLWSELERQVRAYDPWPGSFIETPRGRLIIWEAEAEDVADGAIGSIDPRGLVTADGRLVFRHVQPGGGRRMSWDEYLRGGGALIVGSSIVG